MPRPRIELLARRGRRLLGSFSLGIGSQALAFVAGILVIRILDRTAYASYALSAAVVGAVVVVADSGISSTLMALSAQPEGAGRFRALLAAALRWRRVLWAVVLLPTLVVLVLLLLGTGVPVALALLIAAVTGALSYNNLTIGLASIDYQLSGRFRALQGLDVVNNAARVLLVSAGALLGVQSVVYYLALALAVSTVQVLVMSRQVRRRHPPLPPSTADHTAFRGAVRSTLAFTAFLILGEQLVNVILVQRGNPLAIADIAALNRFAVAFGVFNVVAANLAAPYIARAGALRAPVARAARTVLLGYAVICVAYFAGIVLFEPVLLGVLGPRYDHLRVELLVVAAGTAVFNFAASGLGLVAHSRGWVRHSWTYGVFLAVWLVWGLFVVDVSTTLGAVVLSASLSLPQLGLQLVRVVAGFRRLPVAPASIDVVDPAG